MCRCARAPAAARTARCAAREPRPRRAQTEFANDAKKKTKMTYTDFYDALFEVIGARPCGEARAQIDVLRPMQTRGAGAWMPEST